jgi:hypothetical protein
MVIGLHGRKLRINTAGAGRKFLDLAPYLLAQPGHPRRHLDAAGRRDREVTSSRRPTKKAVAADGANAPPINRDV